jgi:hypothetical protein
MNFFLALLLSCAFLQTASAAGQQNLIIPLKMAIKWFHPQQTGAGGLRRISYCSAKEYESIDAILGSKLSATISEMKDFMRLEKLPGDKHQVSCNNKICDGDFPKVINQEEVAGVQHLLRVQCTETLHELTFTGRYTYSATCRNALKSTICESYDSSTISAV